MLQLVALNSKTWSNFKSAMSAGYCSRIIFIFILAALLSSCRSNPAEEWEKADYKFNFSPAEYKKCLHERLNSKDSTLLFQVSELEYSDSLKYFYKSRDYYPAVMKSFEDSLSVFSLLNVILNVREHGLMPEMYRYNQIIKELSAFYISRQSNTPAAYEHMINTELLLANAIVKYAHDIRFGAVSPAKIYSEGYYLPLADSGKGSVLKPLYQDSILQYLNSIQPANQRYRKMQTALKYFESLENNACENNAWDSIPEVPVKLKAGTQYAPIKPIARRLAMLGFIDTAEVNVKAIDTYDSLMIKSIAKFQKANGLKADGSIGKETLRKLNTPLSVYIEKIKLNLERFRWTTYADSSRYILVNIPDFYLYAVEEEQEKLSIKVCTGKKFVYNPNLSAKRNKLNNNETPLLYGKISYMVLNPTWTVPISIVKKEIYGESIRDTNYLRKKNFRVYRNGKQVSLAGIKLASYSPNRLPFTFVQNPGNGNALGKIKFMFENNFSVYLHDTPTRAPFSNSSRAVSHGCVRVEKPFDLAEYILKDNSKWTADFVRLETGNPANDSLAIKEYKKKRNELRRSGADGRTTRINLDRTIPLYIDYFTAWVNDEGHLSLRDDVYGRDKILKNHFTF